MVPRQLTDYLKNQQLKDLMQQTVKELTRSWSKEACTQTFDVIRLNISHSTMFLCQLIVFRFEQVFKFIKLHLHSITCLVYRLLLGILDLFQGTPIALRECRLQGGGDGVFEVHLGWKLYHLWILLVCLLEVLLLLLINKLWTIPVSEAAFLWRLSWIQLRLHPVLRPENKALLLYVVLGLF